MVLLYQYGTNNMVPTNCTFIMKRVFSKIPFAKFTKKIHVYIIYLRVHRRSDMTMSTEQDSQTAQCKSDRSTFVELHV